MLTQDVMYAYAAHVSSIRGVTHLVKMAAFSLVFTSFKHQFLPKQMTEKLLSVCGS